MHDRGRLNRGNFGERIVTGWLVQLMHFCFKHGIDFNRRVRIARDHFVMELEGGG